MSSTTEGSRSRAVPAQHLDDPDARAVVADREGVGALQPVLGQRVRHEAPVASRSGDPQRLAVLDDPAGEAFAPAGRIGLLLLCEGRRDARRARPHVPADQLAVGRERPQCGHVPVEPPAQRGEEPLGRRLVDRGVGEDLEQLARQLGPALQLLLVAGPEDADDDRAGERVVEDADDQLGVDVGAVGPLDVGVERAPDEVRWPGSARTPRSRRPPPRVSESGTRSKTGRPTREPWGQPRSSSAALLT